MTTFFAFKDNDFRTIHGEAGERWIVDEESGLPAAFETTEADGELHQLSLTGPGAYGEEEQLRALVREESRNDARNPLERRSQNKRLFFDIIAKQRRYEESLAVEAPLSTAPAFRILNGNWTFTEPELDTVLEQINHLRSYITDGPRSPDQFFETGSEQQRIVRKFLRVLKLLDSDERLDAASQLGNSEAVRKISQDRQLEDVPLHSFIAAYVNRDFPAAKAALKNLDRWKMRSLFSRSEPFSHPLVTGDREMLHLFHQGLTEPLFFQSCELNRNDRFEAFVKLCKREDPSAIEELRAFAGGDVLRTLIRDEREIEDDPDAPHAPTYAGFQEATYASVLAILNFMPEKEWPEMIRVDDYQIFRNACRRGDEKLVDLLLKIVPDKELLSMLMAGPGDEKWTVPSEGFFRACKEGHVNVARTLLQAAGNKLHRALLSPEGRRQVWQGKWQVEDLPPDFTYLEVIRKGQIAVLKLLHEELEHDHLDQILNRNRTVTVSLEFIRRKESEEVTFRYAPLVEACESGQFEAAQVIFSQLSDEQAKDLVRESGSALLSYAAAQANERISLLRDSDHVQWNEIQDPEALIVAVKKGLLSFSLDLLGRLDENELLDLLRKNNYRAVMSSMMHAQYELCEVLFGLLPDQEQQQLLYRNCFEILEFADDGEAVPFAKQLLWKIPQDQLNDYSESRGFMKLLIGAAIADDASLMRELLLLRPAEKRPQYAKNGWGWDGASRLFQAVYNNDSSECLKVLVATMDNEERTKFLRCLPQNLKKRLEKKTFTRIVSTLLDMERDPQERLKLFEICLQATTTPEGWNTSLSKRLQLTREVFSRATPAQTRKLLRGRNFEVLRDASERGETERAEEILSHVRERERTELRRRMSLYTEILPLIRFASVLEGSDSAEYFAYNLASLFDSAQEVENFLDKRIPWSGVLHSSMPLHNALVSFSVPAGIMSWDRKSWKEVVLRQMESSESGDEATDLLGIVHSAGGVERQIRRQDHEGISLSLKRLRPHQLVAMARTVEYRQGGSDPELKRACLSVTPPISPGGFQIALRARKRVLQDPQIIENDHIPLIGNPVETSTGRHILLLGKDVDPAYAGYNFMKLSKLDPRQAVIGAFVGCCDHVDREYASMATAKITSVNGGCYALFKQFGPEPNPLLDIIVGKAAVWRSRGKNFVFNQLVARDGYDELLEGMAKRAGRDMLVRSPLARYIVESGLSREPSKDLQIHETPLNSHFPDGIQKILLRREDLTPEDFLNCEIFSPTTTIPDFGEVAVDNAVIGYVSSAV